MDDTQLQHERAIGDILIAELNRKRGTKYVFNRRGNDSPDLIYCDGSSETGVEVVTCYYNSNDAKLKWQNARNLPDAPQRWAGVDFDEALVMQINKALDEKCSKDYGADCLLAVSISPNLTTFKEMDRLVPSIEMPTKHQFKEIYLVGNFGVNNYSNVSDAIWKLYPWDN